LLSNIVLFNEDPFLLKVDFHTIPLLIFFLHIFIVLKFMNYHTNENCQLAEENWDICC